jgi:hypothetical protein
MALVMYPSRQAKGDWLKEAKMLADFLSFFGSFYPAEAGCFVDGLYVSECFVPGQFVIEHNVSGHYVSEP